MRAAGFACATRPKLQEVLQRISDLGLTLLSVSALDD
jgi:hypothetical protein